MTIRCASKSVSRQCRSAAVTCATAARNFALLCQYLQPTKTAPPSIHSAPTVKMRRHHGRRGRSSDFTGFPRSVIPEEQTGGTYHSISFVLPPRSAGEERDERVFVTISP